MGGSYDSRFRSKSLGTLSLFHPDSFVFNKNESILGSGGTPLVEANDNVMIDGISSLFENASFKDTQKSCSGNSSNSSSSNSGVISLKDYPKLINLKVNEETMDIEWEISFSFVPVFNVNYWSIIYTFVGDKIHIVNSIRAASYQKEIVYTI